MVYEFALEPELVATWGDKANFRYFHDKFGLGQPRMMVEYPSLNNWRGQVLKALDRLEDIEKAKVLEMVRILTEKTISRIPHKEYDGTKPWLQNSEQEHAVSPFHAILAKDNPRHHPAILRGDNLDYSEEKPRWLIDRDQCPTRNPLDMAATVESLLRNSTEIIFVDPHFGPENARHRRPLEAFLSAIMTNRGCPVTQVTLLTSNKAPTAFFSSECVSKLPRIIPVGLTVNFLQLAEQSGGEKLHNRYILTDIGGVKFQVGLDDGGDGQTDDVGLMGRIQYDLRWKQYAGSSPAFIRCGEVVTIVGSKKIL